MNLKYAVFGLGLMVAGASQAAPVTVQVTAADRGFYSEAGNHTPSNVFYTTGRVTSAIDGTPSRIVELRSFFVFDIPDLMGLDVASATLVLRLGSSRSDTGSETFTLFDVTTDLGSLLAGTAGVGAFDDLGSGTVLGSETIAAPGGFSFDTVGIDLNTAGLGLIVGGERIVLGGALTSLSGVGEEFLFGGTGTLGLARLDIVLAEPAAVPAPASLPLFLPALAALTLLARRRHT
jgi:hypothetical protein